MLFLYKTEASINGGGCIFNWILQWPLVLGFRFSLESYVSSIIDPERFQRAPPDRTQPPVAWSSERVWTLEAQCLWPWETCLTFGTAPSSSGNYVD